jgi:hypothetical protein
MKEQVQDTGIRKWYGDDFINMQNEILTAVKSIVEDYGNCVISGVITDADGNGNVIIGAGVAYLKDSSGVNGKLCRIYETTIAETSFPVYLVQASRDRNDIADYGRLYEDSATKNIIVEYYTQILTVAPAHSHYIILEANGSVKRLRDAMQDAAYRFVSDTQINLWNAKLNASGYTAADVLSKLLTVDSDTAGINATTIKSVTPGAGGLTLLALAALGANWATLLATAKPTTLAGYGISDALNTSSTAQTKAGTLTVTDLIIA